MDTISNESMLKKFISERLWIGYFENGFDFTSAFNTINITPSVDFPMEIGFVLDENMVVDSSDITINPVNETIHFNHSAVSGLYFQRDYKTRCTKWIGNNDSEQTDFDFSLAEIQLNLLGLQRIFLKKHQQNLPIYNISTSTFTIECYTISVETVCRDIASIMDDFYKACDSHRTRAIGLNQIESALLKKIIYFQSENLLSQEESKRLADQLGRVKKGVPSSNMIEALDLHIMKKKDPLPTQSTWIADVFSKNKLPRSISLLLDSSPKCVNPGTGLMEKFDRKSQLKYTEIKPLYSDIISKLLRQEDRNSAFEQICSEFPFIDPVTNQRDCKHHEMVFRIWYTTSENQVASRLFYIDTNKNTPKSIPLYYQIFGNVDLAIIPFGPDFYNDVDIAWYDNSQLEHIGHLPASYLITISKYLDHGTITEFENIKLPSE